MGVRKDPPPVPNGLRAPGELAQPLDTLSYAEQATLHLLAKGMNNEEIAATLGVTHHTVRARVEEIYSTFAVSRHHSVQRVIVARWWWERGIHAAPESIRSK